MKRDYRNTLFISHLKFKALFDRPQLKVFDRSGLRQFHQQLKTSNTWLLPIGYESPLLSFENITKCVSLLPPVLRKEFYKSADSGVFVDGIVNLIVFEQWLEKKLKRYFNPIADIIAADDRFEQKLSSRKLINASFGEEITTELIVETNIQSSNFYQNTSNQSTSALRCWISEQPHRLMRRSSLIGKREEESCRYFSIVLELIIQKPSSQQLHILT